MEVYSDSRMVDAIEEGKIVSVTEDYAKKEGLPILRKSGNRFLGDKDRRSEDKGEEDFKRVEDFRKPLDWKERQERMGLIDNFHWRVSKRRRELNMSRRQFGEALGENEAKVKLIENGVLEGIDFVLVNKIEEVLGMSFRSAGKKGDDLEMRKLVEKEMKDQENSKNKVEKSKDSEELFGEDIELLD